MPKEKNLNAKLGRLNSLNRNINAYINSKSPNFAAVQAFVMASAEAEVAEGAVAAEQEELEALQDELKALEDIAQPTQAQLDRIAALPDLITTQKDVVTMPWTMRPTHKTHLPGWDARRRTHRDVQQAHRPPTS